MDATHPLRCFVAGQFAGEMTLAACAKRNGVSTDALDVEQPHRDSGLAEGSALGEQHQSLEWRAVLDLRVVVE